MSAIVRIEAFRFIVWNDSRESYSWPHFFVAGIRADGLAYFRNNYTELPNEFHLYPKDFALRLFVKTKTIVESLIRKPNPGNFPHSHETWSFKLYYSDGSSEKLQCVDKDIHFSFADYNDFLSNHAFWGEESDNILTYNGSLTIDDVRGEIASKQVPFAKFYNHRVRIMIDDSNGVEPSVLMQPDGSIWIDKITLGHHHTDFITIDSNGNIQNTGRFPYVEILKKHRVRIIRDISFI